MDIISYWRRDYRYSILVEEPLGVNTWYHQTCLNDPGADPGFQLSGVATAGLEGGGGGVLVYIIPNTILLQYCCTSLREG